jgi:hypothetical protein
VQNAAGSLYDLPPGVRDPHEDDLPQGSENGLCDANPLRSPNCLPPGSLRNRLLSAPQNLRSTCCAMQQLIDFREKIERGLHKPRSIFLLMIGVVEMLIATAFCGVVYALFSGQPLSMLGGTGPMLVFTVLLYQMCLGLWGQEKGSELFLPVLGWVGLWTSLFVILMSIFEACVLIRFFTRFTDEIFAALISIIFISEALKNLFGYL